MLVTGQTFTQNEFTLAGTLLNNAHQKYLLKQNFLLSNEIGPLLLN